VTNVTWVWSPNVAYPSSVPISRLFPGDAYVDWTGFDGYNLGHHHAARPEVRGFLGFNHAKEADWRVQSSDASRIAYANAVAASRYV